MTVEIRRIMMKRIWRIPFILLVIVTLGVSFVAVVVIYSETVASTPSIALGADNLIDGYHVDYDGNLKAKWTAQTFRLSGDGNFDLDLRCDYISENPTLSKIFYSEDNVSISEVDWEYKTSIILMEIYAYHKKAGDYWDDIGYTDSTRIIPIAPKFTDSKSCIIEFRDDLSHEFNVTKVMAQADGIDVGFSWVRVFRDKTSGTLYYQWLQEGSVVEKLRVDRTYSGLSGWFAVYYPIPENVTRPLLPWEFDYVKWIEFLL